jgi:hypothetical protein
MKSINTQNEAHCQNCKCSGRASFVDRWVMMTFLNAIWFIGWFVLIYNMDLSMWWILIPVFFHWSGGDFGLRADTRSGNYNKYDEEDTNP